MPHDPSRSAGDTSPLAGVLGQLRELLGCVDVRGISLQALERQTRHQLVEWAESLGLTGLQRLTKNALAEQLRDALARFGFAVDAPGTDDTPGPLARKFDLGPGGERVPRPAHIPWAYGRDRVTAMAVDPERLFVYWEVTDDAIARARAGLGAGGSGAWLDLRVYDVTGRLFDGTNAHHYFDQRVERHDRQWFFAIGRPTSSAVVEIGLRSHEGYFVRMARSGRVDFPAREAAAPGGVEWLTVHTASGPVDTSVPAASAAPAPEPVTAAVHTGADDAGDDAGAHESGAAWAWESGPFTYPIESPAYVAECGDGTVVVSQRDGLTRVVYGPWHVVIRGTEVWRQRRVIATWEFVWSWATSNGWSHGARTNDAHGVGASEGRLGASEGHALGASERRLGGASELAYGGASERSYGGASERRRHGASEERLGASESRVSGEGAHQPARTRRTPER